MCGVPGVAKCLVDDLHIVLIRRQYRDRDALSLVQHFVLEN
jgi:hypothetical protein